MKQAATEEGFMGAPESLRDAYTYARQSDRFERAAARILVSAAVPLLVAALLWQWSRAAALAAAVVGAIPLVIHGVRACRAFVRKGQ